MSALRTTLRVARLTARYNNIALQRTTPAAQRGLVISYPVFKASTVDEDPVPATLYTTEGKIHTTVPVSPEASTGPAAPKPNEMENLTTLSDEVYKTLPATVKSMTVKGKVIIITGGARGLGNFMARACAEAGAKAIALFDANEELGDAAAADLHAKTGLPVSFYKVDVRHEHTINAAVQSVVTAYGAPDVLVNSAGIANSNIPAEHYDAEMFRRLIDINLNGSFFMSQAVGRAAIAAGKPASIILVASMSAGIVNYPQEQSCYNASKAGVVHLGRSLAAEWAKYNIRVNCISPGYMDTALNKVPALDAQKTIWKGLTPQERLGNVDELNALCVFLASDGSSFMTGANCVIDGGYSLY